MKTKFPHPQLLAVLIGLALLANNHPVQADDYFDPAFLTMNGIQVETLDLSHFATSGRVPPGTYMVSVFVNRNDMGQHSLTFAPDAKGQVEAQLTPAFLEEMGVNVKGMPNMRNLPLDQPVENLASLIEHASIRFSFAKLQLDISIPQIAMQPSTRGAIDPAKWDHGVPAFLLNYNLNGSRSWQSGGVDSNSLFVAANGGFNLDVWRLRSSMYGYKTMQKAPGQSKHSVEKLAFSNIYLMRDIRALNAELLLGENSTSNDVFDSVPFSGVRMSSNDEMLPYVMRGFAPVIEGIAQSNARITVLQNGSIIYQTYVAPGPFRLEDLGQTGQGGDLTVNITEADGTVRTQVIAVSSLPVMRREGSLKYDVTAGRYNGGITAGSREAEFLQGTVIYGLPFNMTLYGGALMARDYRSAVAGTGVSLGMMGALSADVTASRARIRGLGEQQKGESYRLRYAKSMLSTGTSIDLAAYRYSTRHYYSFADYNNTGYQLRDDQAPWVLARQRSAFQLRTSQALGRWGAAYISASRHDYWGKNQVMNTVSAGYSGNYKGVSYGLAYSIDRTRGNGDWPENRTYAFNMSVPLNVLGSKLASSNAYASYQATHQKNGRVQQSAGVSGSAFDSRFSYSAMQGWSNGGQSDNSTLNAAWSGSKGNLSGGYSQTSGNRSINFSGNGGLVVHPEGITFSKSLGSSVAIVSAPEATGASVGYGGAKIDSRGYALVPHMINYQGNNINLNPASLPDNVDLVHNSATVYPTKGAVVMATFATKVGHQALITLERRTGTVPFGAIASLISDENSLPNTGIVGDAGQLYMSGLPEVGEIRVKWGRQDDQQCVARYSLKNIPAASDNNPILTLAARCK
ncbi:fimbria/pilus outer membrane usher protein [Candidatus Pantoea multigeneris]|uniref:Fimbrial biogenesis outer membrane usher protein n=1 Tax=Candidatus Pantoea multigeneris TaxID=2608357 RepID=A0ABX0RJJ4_9GAMM|nr:fimbria/pilus outer membrane usher protein [Pantoea multigeneris]NIF23455.1 fimbrial biogenesis outer membrane usher protein [Pantoea multigeneris]